MFDLRAFKAQSLFNLTTGKPPRFKYSHSYGGISAYQNGTGPSEAERSAEPPWKGEAAPAPAGDGVEKGSDEMPPSELRRDDTTDEVK